MNIMMSWKMIYWCTFQLSTHCENLREFHMKRVGVRDVESYYEMMQCAQPLISRLRSELSSNILWNFLKFSRKIDNNSRRSSKKYKAFPDFYPNFHRIFGEISQLLYAGGVLQWPMGHRSIIIRSLEFLHEYDGGIRGDDVIIFYANFHRNFNSLQFIKILLRLFWELSSVTWLVQVGHFHYNALESLLGNAPMLRKLKIGTLIFQAPHLEDNDEETVNNSRIFCEISTNFLRIFVQTCNVIEYFAANTIWISIFRRIRRTFYLMQILPARVQSMYDVIISQLDMCQIWHVAAAQFSIVCPTLMKFNLSNSESMRLILDLPNLTHLDVSHATPVSWEIANDMVQLEKLSGV